MLQLSFIKVEEQLSNSFLATKQVTFVDYSSHRMSWNLPLLLLYLKCIYNIFHGKIGKAHISRIAAIWNKDRHVYVSPCTD